MSKYYLFILSKRGLETRPCKNKKEAFNLFNNFKFEGHEPPVAIQVRYVKNLNKNKAAFLRSHKDFLQ